MRNTKEMPPVAGLIRPCIVCASTERSVELRLGDYEIHRCPCGLRTLSPEPAEETLVEVFDDGTIYSEAESLRVHVLEQNHRSLYDVEKFVGPGRLLDVGCGLGYLLESARARGWEAVGVDPSPFSVRRAREKGFEAHRGLLHELGLPAASFDAISLLQVVEHLIDARALLAECRRLLKPGGALLVETPNPASLLAAVKREGFNYWIPPVHCVWYTPDALGRVLAAAGYTPVKVSTWSARTPVLHDGIDVVASTKLGRRLPGRMRRATGSAVGALADAFGRGSIVEAVALRWEDA
ncbi:MAG TPA: class I SAM-dependent methyltransferase [Actinomycetota bacterium]|nr:class I SAM-dependent methyltransferase [Actinomycetota bacterium]